MKITSAWIDDPTQRGTYEPPTMCVEVTEEPTVSIPEETFAGGWTVGKYGPFVAYSQQDSPGTHSAPSGKATASDFNIRFRGRFPVVVDIRLFTPAEEISGFSLPLTRARQLVRKHVPVWKLVVSERAAESGGLLWLPTLIHPTCRWNERNGKAVFICHAVPARYVRIGNCDVPLCGTHIEEHNSKQAERRTSRAS